MVLKGTELRLAGPEGEAAPDRVGHAGGHAVGRGQHADGLRHSRCRPLHRLSALEHQQPGGAVLGLAAVQRTARLERAASGSRCWAAPRRLWWARACWPMRPQHHSGAAPQRATLGILAALGAGLLWGTMYIPYRKAYISGMNPLSFVTVFTFGELGTMFALAAVFHGGFGHAVRRNSARRGPPSSGSSWAASAGCWATCSSNTPPSTSASAAAFRSPTPTSSGGWPGARWSSANWPAWASTAQVLVIAGIVHHDRRRSGDQLCRSAGRGTGFPGRRPCERECDRYGLNLARVERTLEGNDPLSGRGPKRHWWEALVVLAAIGVFVYLAAGARRQAITVDVGWIVVLGAVSIVLLVVCGLMLWRRTRFS